MEKFEFLTDVKSMSYVCLEENFYSIVFRICFYYFGAFVGIFKFFWTFLKKVLTLPWHYGIIFLAFETYAEVSELADEQD